MLLMRKSPTAEETAALSEWKKYRVLLMRVLIHIKSRLAGRLRGSRPIDIRRGAGICCRHRVNVIQHSVKSQLFLPASFTSGLQFQLNQTDGSHCSINQRLALCGRFYCGAICLGIRLFRHPFLTIPFIVWR